MALVKTNAEKNETKQSRRRAVGTWVRHFYIISSNMCHNPKSYFSKNVIFRKESVARFPAFPLKDCIVSWKMGPSVNRFQHHFKLRTVCVYHDLFLVTMAFLEVHVYNYLEYFHQELELASSLSFWTRCKFSSNIKPSFQISSWSYCAYIVVLLSTKFGILWRMGG